MVNKESSSSEFIYKLPSVYIAPPLPTLTFVVLELFLPLAFIVVVTVVTVDFEVLDVKVEFLIYILLST